MMPKAQERRYTLAEIDRMRSAIKRRAEAWVLYSTGLFQTDPQEVRDRRYEDELRTHLLNGTEPEELEEAAREEADRRKQIAFPDRLTDWRTPTPTQT
jgi:hypothetical protein